MPSADAILLDTHVWIWLRAGQTAGLRRATRDRSILAYSRRGHVNVATL